MITVKVHDAGNGRNVIAICDSELIGRKIEDAELQLDLGSDFYRGEEKSEEEVRKLLQDTYVVNFVGEKAVKLGMKVGLVKEDRIIRIDDVPHAQSMG